MSLPIHPEGLNYNYIGGIDEVGYGPGAGPVVSALVILPEGFESDLIKDSKKLSDKKLKEAYDLIIANAVDYSVQAVSVKYINEHGILPALYRSMQKCINNLQTEVEYLLIDGNKWEPYAGIPYETVVKGDSTYMCIAAASIVAKVRRDHYMVQLSERYPEYDWATNKGYLTKKHLDALKKYGATDYHRTQYVRNHI